MLLKVLLGYLGLLVKHRVLLRSTGQTQWCNFLGSRIRHFVKVLSLLEKCCGTMVWLVYFEEISRVYWWSQGAWSELKSWWLGRSECSWVYFVLDLNTLYIICNDSFCNIFADFLILILWDLFGCWFVLTAWSFLQVLTKRKFIRGISWRSSIKSLCFVLFDHSHFSWRFVSIWLRFSFFLLTSWTWSRRNYFTKLNFSFMISSSST